MENTLFAWTNYSVKERSIMSFHAIFINTTQHEPTTQSETT
jgi:hypothetical protein